jgi:undecaprenyl-diphosphatase
MKLSWSHKLFFKINQQIGRRPWLDVFMAWSARWLLLLLLCGFFILFQLMQPWLFFWDDRILFSPLVYTTVFSFFVSYAIALLWRHARPIREFPDIQVLVSTLGTWKSFPSDHTIAATLIAIGAWIIAPVWIALIFSLAATLVAVSRVYAGVHYPRDILGGALIPIVVYAFIVYMAEGLPNFFL